MMESSKELAGDCSAWVDEKTVNQGEKLGWSVDWIGLFGGFEVCSLSFKSQQLTALFLAIRLVCSAILEADIHTVLDFATLISTAWVIYMIQFKLKSTYIKELDNMPLYYMVVPSAIVAVLIHPHTPDLSISRFLWAFCVYLESVLLLPQLKVANAFVHQYYLILHQSPELAINEKILSIGYGEFRAEITTVDSQESYNGGVLVLVTGYLTRNDNFRQKFTQSFPGTSRQRLFCFE
ncbi:hypothetical protein GH714_025699 [Hevea brasiliensis]|uniref:NTF2 domain-containing protein n=1 Tax=Hevea brasiliensis TaxID=3981 RepID=A0A6A6KX07_HEVBR|nr:hypothetical protein GH714_025699 [Hevea brasiliensis]